MGGSSDVVGDASVAGDEEIAGESAPLPASPEGEGEEPHPSQEDESPPPPPQKRSQRQRKEIMPRGLVLAWCFWLIGSWCVALWIDSTVPAVRWMIFASLLGLMVIWPLIRLSQDITQGAARLSAPGNDPNETETSALTPLVILADWFSLILVFQTVVWPLRLTTRWSVEQAAWLDAAVAAWSLLAAAIVAFGCSSRSAARRVVAMILCLLLLLGEPAAIALLDMIAPLPKQTGWTMRVSPLEALWKMTGPPTSWQPGPWRERVFAVAAAAVLAWIIVGIGLKKREEAEGRG